jgi:hypothetical protein
LGGAGLRNKVLAGEGGKEQKGREKTGKDRIHKIIQLPPN